VIALESLMAKFKLGYPKLVANVTDTEATMVAAGRLLVTRSAELQGNTAWGPCVDHLLECTTGIAFEDTPNSLLVMNSCRKLCGYFSSSSQANDILLALQTSYIQAQQSKERAVTVIQDVATRWWSTYSMCKRLRRLKIYFDMMVLQGSLSRDLNLTEDQWETVSNLVQLLEPFMEAQKLLEGETYVTISFVPTIVVALRRGLQALVAGSLDNVKVIASKMLDDFNSRWGQGGDGTMFEEHLTEGPRRRPKGLPLHTLIASALDPRFKALLDFDVHDRECILNEVRNKLIEIAMENVHFDDITAAEHQATGSLNSSMTIVNSNHDIQRVHPLLDTHAKMVAEYNARRLNAISSVSDPVTKARQARSAAASQVDLEMAAYDLEPVMELFRPIGDDGACEYTNPLLWWKSREHLYPLHAKLARRYLCVPATSAPSERVFSSAGLTISKTRASLNPETADALIFLHDCWDLADEFVKNSRTV
jgi:zinc finger BED domain-containing protein 1 (E3 SUMO-protein ligase ZBED1)